MCTNNCRINCAAASLHVGQRIHCVCYFAVVNNQQVLVASVYWIIKADHQLNAARISDLSAARDRGIKGYICGCAYTQPAVRITNFPDFINCASTVSASNDRCTRSCCFSVGATDIGVGSESLAAGTCGPVSSVRTNKCRLTVASTDRHRGNCRVGQSLQCGFSCHGCCMISASVRGRLAVTLNLDVRGSETRAVLVRECESEGASNITASGKVRDGGIPDLDDLHTVYLIGFGERVVSLRADAFLAAKTSPARIASALHNHIFVP
mmetsp:Transcript_4192/g.5587  ORF Transcript_4192/g.5587 Transcript_4192/m.5587 type:complete len:266 (+) Transcript_4192:714-1511(+)